MNEELQPLPPDVVGLLAKAKRPAPPAGFEEALWARVSASATAPAVASSVFGAKAGLLASATLLVGVGAGIALDRTLFATPPAAPEVRVVYREVRVEVPVPSPPPAAPPAPRPAPAAVVAPAPRVEQDRLLAEERGIIEMARSALARGEAALAISHFQRHSSRFPTGQLAEEREALWVRALVTQGELAEARRRAAAFFERYPESLLGPGVSDAVK